MVQIVMRSFSEEAEEEEMMRRAAAVSDLIYAHFLLNKEIDREVRHEKG